MGIFGNNPMFNPQEYRTPGYGDGLPGVNQQMGDMFGAVFPQTQNRMPMVDIPQSKSPGFFGKGGGWRNALGAIADGMVAAGGGRGVYAPMMEQRRQETLAEQQRQQELADYAQKKNDALEAWKAQQQWQIDHPQPTDLQQNVKYLQTLDPNSEAYQVARLAMPGAGYSPDVLDARMSSQRDLIDYRTNAAIRSKAAPSYSATHPTSLSARGVTTRRVGGRTYYNVGGKWYDNPEGR